MQLDRAQLTMQPYPFRPRRFVAVERRRAAGGERRLPPPARALPRRLSIASNSTPWQRDDAYVAPELRLGLPSSAASDMWSFGLLLFHMHWPAQPLPVAGLPLALPADADPTLCALLSDLLHAAGLARGSHAGEAARAAAARPAAADVLLHPYFCSSHLDTLIAGGDMPDQNQKLDAVRTLLSEVRREHRADRETITVERGESLVPAVLAHFRAAGGGAGGGGGAESAASGRKVRARAPLRVTFDGEAGVDEGGLSERDVPPLLRRRRRAAAPPLRVRVVVQGGGGGAERRRGRRRRRRRRRRAGDGGAGDVDAGADVGGGLLYLPRAGRATARPRPTTRRSGARSSSASTRAAASARASRPRCSSSSRTASATTARATGARCATCRSSTRSSARRSSGS